MEEDTYHSDTLVEQMLAETGRWLGQPATEVPEHKICLDDIRFATKFAEQVAHIHSVLKFVQPLLGKTVKINGFKFNQVASRDLCHRNVFETKLDYEEVK